jgi:hypothetical protein
MTQFPIFVWWLPLQTKEQRHWQKILLVIAVFVAVELDCFFLDFGRVEDCLGYGGGDGCPRGDLCTPLVQGMVNPCRWRTSDSSRTRNE